MLTMEGGGELGPGGQRAEDLDTARLVTRFQAGDRKAYADIYTRYFERVYSYLIVVFKDQQEAEDGAQEVFTNILEALPRYERRRQPFRAWLFVAVRNYALSRLEKLNHVEPVDPTEISRRRRELAEEDDYDLRALDWISDPDLLMFVGRLPLPQRQVLLLRYMLDLDYAQIARILDRGVEDVRGLHYRSVEYLRDHLDAIGRGPKQARRQAGMSRCPDHSLVLRSRRFSL